MSAPAIPGVYNGSIPASGQPWKKPLRTQTTSATAEHTMAVAATSGGQCPFRPTCCHWPVLGRSRH